MHLAGALGQQRPAEETGRGAAVAGVDVLPEGHDADLLLGQFRLDVHPILEIPGQPVQEAVPITLEGAFGIGIQQPAGVSKGRTGLGSSW